MSFSHEELFCVKLFIHSPSGVTIPFRFSFQEAGAIGNLNDAGTRRSCAPRPVVIDLRNADVGTIKIIAPPKLETVICNGYCFPSQVSFRGAEFRRTPSAWIVRPVISFRSPGYSFKQRYTSLQYKVKCCQTSSNL